MGIISEMYARATEFFNLEWYTVFNGNGDLMDEVLATSADDAIDQYREDHPGCNTEDFEAILAND